MNGHDFLVLLSSAAVIIGFASTCVGLLTSFHARQTKKEVQLIAVRVNGNIAALVARIDQLTGVMHENDVPVPPPAIEIPETENPE